MAWRLKHSTPRIYHPLEERVTEPTVILDRVMDLSERAARQQLAFYTQGWRDEDPENRHLDQLNGLNAILYTRPPGCACHSCANAPTEPDPHDNRRWWHYGVGHTTSYVKLKRTTAPVPSTTVERYRIVDRVLDDRGQIEHGREPTLWSKHLTKTEAQKGLTAAVSRWRDGGAKTARRHSNEAYMLRWARCDYSLMMIERIPS